MITMRFLLPMLFFLAALMPAVSAQLQQQNVVYGEAHGVGLVMDIFTPAKDANGLGVIDVISGGWDAGRSKIRDHQRAQVFRILCDHGYTVFAVRPGSLSRFSIPDMVQHLEQGVVWVKSHADDFGVDSSRLGLMGASAGGHLASLLAVTHGSSDHDPGDDRATVKAVAVFFPPTDFLVFGENSGSEASQRVRAVALRGLQEELSDSDAKQALKAISPARLVTDKAPPFLLIHGTADDVVPQQQSELLQSALQEKGISAELILKEGGGHPWPTIHEEVAVIADWFDSQLTVQVAESPETTGP